MSCQTRSGQSKEEENSPNTAINRISQHAPTSHIGCINPQRQPAALNLLVQRKVRNPGLQQTRRVISVDVQDAVHPPPQVDHHAPGNTRRRPAVPDIPPHRDGVHGYPVPVSPPHDRLHLAHITGIHDRAGNQVILQGNVERVVSVSATSPVNQHIRQHLFPHTESLVDEKNVRVLNIPPVHQRLVVDLDVLAAKDLPQLGNSLVELGAGRVGRETG